MEGDVVDAYDGAGALALVDRLSPELLVVDQRLPDMTGDRLLDAVHRQRGDATYTVLLTSDLSRTALDTAVAAEVQGILRKPYDLDAVRELLFRNLPSPAELRRSAAGARPDALPCVPPRAEVEHVLSTLLDRAVTADEGEPVLPRPGRPALAVAYVDDRLRTVAALAADARLTVALAAAVELNPRGLADDPGRRLAPHARENLQETAQVCAQLFTQVGGAGLRVYAVHLPGELPPPVTAATFGALRLRLDLQVQVEGYGGGGLSLVVPR